MSFENDGNLHHKCHCWFTGLSRKDRKTVGTFVNGGIIINEQNFCCHGMGLESKDNSIIKQFNTSGKCSAFSHSEGVKLNVSASSFIKVDNDMVIDIILECPSIFLQCRKSVPLSSHLLASKILCITAQGHVNIDKPESSIKL